MVLGVSSFRGRIASLLFLAVLVSFPAISDEIEPLSICLLEDNLPYSGKATIDGFDYELGAKVAEIMGREFVPVWVSNSCLLYTSPSPRDRTRSRMPSSA